MAFRLAEQVCRYQVKNIDWKLDLHVKNIDRSILTLHEIILRKTVGFRHTQTQGMKSICATVAPILYIK